MSENTEDTTGNTAAGTTEGAIDGVEGTSKKTVENTPESTSENTVEDTGEPGTNSASHIIPPRVVVRFTAKNLRKKNGEHHPGSNSDGYFGYVLLDTYECPCGAGTVEAQRFFTTHDERAQEEYSVHLSCANCRQQYKFTKNPTYTPASNWALIPR